jgi:hypothetical protein
MKVPFRHQKSIKDLYWEQVAREEFESMPIDARLQWAGLRH